MLTSFYNNIKLKLGAENPLRYLKSAFWLVAAKVASMTVSLFAMFYIARTLGPQNFGELSYAQSVVGIIALFSSLTAALYRDLVKNKDDENTQLGTAWIVSFGSAFLTAILALIYTFIIPNDTITLLIIGILALAQFFTPFSIIRNVFYAKTETKILSIADFLIHLLISGAKIVAMLLGQGVLVLASIMLLEQLVIASTQTFLYIKVHKGSFLKWHFSTTYAKHLLLDSLPIVIIAGSGAISARIDQIFIKHYLTTETVGLYSVAVQLSEVWQFIPALILGATFPAFINARNNNPVYRKRFLTLIGGALLYGFTLAGLVTVFAQPFILLIYGNAFYGSISLLQVYVWSIIGTTIGLIVNQHLHVENLRRIQIVTGLVPMILNVALNLILIPKYGAHGAAIATLISYTTLPFIPFLFTSVRSKLL